MKILVKVMKSTKWWENPTWDDTVKAGNPRAQRRLFPAGIPATRRQNDLRRQGSASNRSFKKKSPVSLLLD